MPSKKGNLRGVPLAVASLVGFMGCARPLPTASSASQGAELSCPPDHLGSGELIGWEVVDPFRLVTDDGGTEEMFSRFDYYYANVDHQVNTRLPGTAWDLESRSYRAGYLTPTTWKVRLTYPFEGQCQWQVGSEQPETSSCKQHLVTVNSGQTRITVIPRGIGCRQAETEIVPRDVLIVTLGDSYASGEGVPDIRHWWWQTPKWMDRACHRSLFAGPGLAALMYARLNPHVSVTHLTFACSGAELKTGVLELYAGAEPAFNRRVSSQIEDLKASLKASNRVPDYLTISIGGNDVGFGPLVKSGLAGSGGVRKYVADVLPGKIESFVGLFDEFATKLTAAGIDSKRTKILVTEYPNPTSLLLTAEGKMQDRESLNESCGTIGDGAIGFLPSAISLLTSGRLDLNSETVEMFKDVSRKLNESIGRLANTLGGSVVRGIAEDFRRHGYCGPALNLHGANTRWVNTVFDATQIAGVFNGAASLPMHPNIRGQDNYARHILEGIISGECSSERNLFAPNDPVRKQLCEGDGQALLWRWRGGDYRPSANREDTPRQRAF